MDLKTPRKLLIGGFVLSLVIAISVSLVFEPEPEKIDSVTIEGDFELDNTETSFRIHCGSVFEDDVLKSGREYSFNCRERLPDATDHKENFDALAILRLERLDGEVIDSERILDPSKLDSRSYVGKQNFVLDSPQRPGRYILTMEAIEGENRTDSGSLNISYDDEPRTQSFRFYSFEELSSYEYRESILHLSSLVIASLFFSLFSKLIEFGRE